MLVGMIVGELIVMFVAPVMLAWFLWRRYGTPWSLVVAGATTFVASQVVHLPLNAALTVLFRLEWMPKPPEGWQLPFNAVVLGLTAGLCEETARCLAYRFWVKSARTWRQAWMFGAGHGGIESLLTGLLVAVTVVNMVVLRDMDVSQLGLSSEQAAQAAQQVAAFWDTPLYMPWLAAAERLMAMLTHLALSALVMWTFTRCRLWPLCAAIAWHAASNAVGVYALAMWGAVVAEGALALASLGSALILWVTWRADRESSADSMSVPG